MTNSPDQPYDPQLAPFEYPDTSGYPSVPPPYPPVASPFGAVPGYPPPAAPAPYAPPAYPGYPGYPGGPMGYDPYLGGRPAGTNGMAIASLICSLAGLFFCGVPSVVGLILGIVAMGQCKKTGQEGHGMALAGTIIGAVLTAVAVIGFIAYAVMLGAAVNGASY